jgi:uncharacterized damage-inducible protein DinB
MAQDNTNLTPFYEGWDRYQDLLVESIGSLTPEQLAMGAAPHLRPVWQLAAHIVSARVGWFQSVLGEAPDRPDLTEMHDWDLDDAPPRGADELVGALRQSWDLISGCLARWTPDDLDETFTTQRGNTFTRQWIIWHVIEHDLHHGGELFFTLGMHGLPTPDL